MGVCASCFPEIKAMQATLKDVQAITDEVKLISDQTMSVVSDVRGYVGGIQSKCAALEDTVENDVKGTINQIRSILDTVPKIPDGPDASAFSLFGVSDYIPGMTSTPAPPPPGVASTTAAAAATTTTNNHAPTTAAAANAAPPPPATPALPYASAVTTPTMVR